jgi:DNA topoisomerase IB
VDLPRRGRPHPGGRHGRGRQYRYHDRWREQRDRESRTGCPASAASSPGSAGPTRSTCRARASPANGYCGRRNRLIDLGFFRPGGKEYAVYNGSFGLAPIRREHVTC